MVVRDKPFYYNIYVVLLQNERLILSNIVI